MVEKEKTVDWVLKNYPHTIGEDVCDILRKYRDGELVARKAGDTASTPIDAQAAQILSLKGSLEDMELISDADEKKARSLIEALKEKLITEKSYHLYYKCQGECDRAICSAGAHKRQAHEQLKTEMPEVGWE